MKGSHERRALIASTVALVATVFVLVVGYLQNESREEETRKLAIENCMATNDSKRALVIVLNEAVAIRRDVGDPAAEDFARAYAQIVREHLQPRECN